MASNKQGEEEFVIIGAGLPRTGTTTLQSVLQDLLGKPCYHMVEVETNTQHIDFWSAALKGEKMEKEEWKKILKDYGAGVDAPLSLCYKELMEVYPNAKVLLSVRDPEKWYESVTNTTVVFTILMNSWIGYIFVNIIKRKWKKFPKFLMEVHEAFLGDNWLEWDKADYLYHYHKHMEEVKKIVPENKLLIFNVNEGYAPLCKFLDVPTREGSLPRLNDTRDFRGMQSFIKILVLGVVVGFSVSAVVGAWAIKRYYC